MISASVQAQVSVEMNFILHEPDYEAVDTLTCGINTNVPPLIIWPSFPTGVFYAYWLIDSGFTRVDVNPIPLNFPPYSSDYIITFGLANSQTDTLVISWNSLPPQIDSIRIEDAIALVDTGKIFSKAIYPKQESTDSLEYNNPPGWDITTFLVRVYYNKSVEQENVVTEPHASVSTPGFIVSPNPAREYIDVNSTGLTRYSRYALYNYLGKKIKTFLMNSISDGNRSNLTVFLPVFTHL